MSISAQFIPQKISVPFTKFEGNKSEHLGQLFVTSQNDSTERN